MNILCSPNFQIYCYIYFCGNLFLIQTNIVTEIISTSVNKSIKRPEILLHHIDTSSCWTLAWSGERIRPWGGGVVQTADGPEVILSSKTPSLPPDKPCTVPYFRITQLLGSWLTKLTQNWPRTKGKKMTIRAVIADKIKPELKRKALNWLETIAHLCCDVFKCQLQWDGKRPWTISQLF